MENDVTPTRRHVVTAGAAATLGIATAAALTACGSSSSSGSSGTSNNTANGAAGTGSLAQLAAIPVGGAVAAKGADGKPIVVAQPEAGKVVAFSAICTHQGCTVQPSDKKLVCPCHGSQFDAFTGAVLSGPAPSPLSAVTVKIDGSAIVAG